MNVAAVQRLIGIAGVTLVVTTFIYGTRSILTPHQPSIDACVQVDLRNEADVNGVSASLVHGRIRTIDKTWVSLYGARDSQRKDDYWIPISNVTAIAPADGCK